MGVSPSWDDIQERRNAAEHDREQKSKMDSLSLSSSALIEVAGRSVEAWERQRKADLELLTDPSFNLLDNLRAATAQVSELKALVNQLQEQLKRENFDHRIEISSLQAKRKCLLMDQRKAQKEHNRRGR